MAVEIQAYSLQTKTERRRLTNPEEDSDAEWDMIESLPTALWSKRPGTFLAYFKARKSRSREHFTLAQSKDESSPVDVLANSEIGKSW